MDRLGDYRLRKRLAVGGMGEVYLGEKIGPEGFVKPVVLKCVLPQLAKDRGFVQLFLDEARLAALLNHPNIAQVYDFGFVDETYFIAMEYVPGYTFDDIRRKLRSIGQFMPLQHIANVASQACQGLHHAHVLTDARGESLGLVHRDVSPHNLIVSVDGTVKLVDFGIAKARSGLTRVRAKGAVGKHGYTSPEQSRGEPVDGRSDVFSLGICLWELTTNERLWDPNLERPPDYHPDQPIRGVDSIRPEVPRQFTHILQKALAIDVEQRFSSAREMHVELERFQAAMTHYAGQAALAQFIADLVEGRVSSPTAPSPFASLTEGLSVDNGDSSRSTPRRVPAAWEATDAKTARPRPSRPSGAHDIEFDGDPGEIPELARERVTAARARPTPVSPSPTPSPRPRPVRLGPILMLVLVAGAVAAGWAMRDRLGEWIGRLTVDSKPAAAGLTSDVRVHSQPPGARVWVDGRELEARTPLAVELIPDVEHLIEVRLEGKATAVRRITGSVSSEPETIDLVLEPAGSLEILSEPPGARVVVDGREAPGVTPLVLDDVPAGRSIRVRAERAGLQPAVRDVSVSEGETLRVEFELGRAASTE